MKILSIGSDRTLFEEGSEAQRRQREYAALFEELHVVVFSARSTNYESRITNGRLQIAENAWVYSTDSKSRWHYVFDAARIGKTIIHNSQFIIPNSVVTCQDPFESGLAGWLIARATTIKLHLQIHTDFLSPYFRKESFLNYVRVRIAKFLLPKADGIRVVSYRIKQSLIANSYKLEASPTVLPIFVDAVKIRSTPVTANLRALYPQWKHLGLMTSRLTREKNIAMALLALKQAFGNNPAIGLVIAGEGAELENLQQITHNLQLENQVAFVGQKSAEELFSYYKTADFFLQTSLYEGYGRSLVEAALCGTPAISSPVGVAEELKDAGTDVTIVTPPTVHTFAYALLRTVGMTHNQNKGVFHLPEDIVSTGKENYLSHYKASLETCLSKV